jgi:hypothetical protein
MPPALIALLGFGDEPFDLSNESIRSHEFTWRVAWIDTP